MQSGATALTAIAAAILICMSSTERTRDFEQIVTVNDGDDPCAFAV